MMRLHFVAGAFLFTAGCHVAAIAVRPDNSRITYVVDNQLKDCDQALVCKAAIPIPFKPVAASFYGNGTNLAFLSDDGRLYTCDSAGGGCMPHADLHFNDPIALSGGPNGNVVVISKTGALDICNAGGCQKH